MFRIRSLVVTFLLSAAVSVSQAAPKVDLVNGFESPDELKAWQISSAGTKLVDEGVTQGKKALELTFDPKGRWNGAGMHWSRPRRDWSAWDVLLIDLTNPNDRPIRAGITIGDEAWNGKPTYWNRHNRGVVLPPGKGQIVVPVRGLYRGEPGSRNNDIKTDIDPTRITRFTLGFGKRGEEGKVIIDNIRFTKSGRPESVWAFDFGAASQTVMPGWTPVSNRTRFGGDARFGWVGGLTDGVARSTTFGTMLTEDFIECRGQTFRIAAEPGRYEVMIIWENSGYWGGEQAKHTVRSVSSGGRELWSEERPQGAATALHRFENIEPVGVDIWDTYMMGHLIKPVRFQVTAGRRGIELAFVSDNSWSCHVSAIVVYKTGDDEAKKWVDLQWDTLAKEFRAKAIPLDAKSKPFALPAAWENKGLVAWAVSLDDEVKPQSVPPAGTPAPHELAITLDAVKGEYEPASLVVRPTVDLKDCRVILAWREGRELPATVHMVRYNTRRGFGSLAYTINTFDLRDFETVDLPKDVTREFVVTVRVPPDAEAGIYPAALVLAQGAGQNMVQRLAVRLTVNVHDVRLDRETDYLFGFFGLEPNRSLVGGKYDEYLDQTLSLLREHGMNALTRAPSMELTGWKDGKPLIDFGDCDKVYALYRKHGFTKAVANYGGMLRGVHGRYEKGAQGEKVERESGVPYPEALMRVWGAIDEHARANNWPLIYYTLCDETRVRERAEKEIEFMKMMSAVSKRYPRTVRTSGSYSVDFNTRPEDKNNLLYWHQRFFETLDANSLNRHDQSVMDETKKLGKELHTYNQGRDRWSFGLYQWSEYAKGVSARWQWHLNILHGYQFFDLDGREPDPAMIVYTSKAIYPTIMFERCREGAEDFYLYQTLQHLIDANVKAGRKAAETAAAAAMLKQMTDAVALNQRRAPEGYDPHADKMKLIEAIRSIK